MKKQSQRMNNIVPQNIQFPDHLHHHHHHHHHQQQSMISRSSLNPNKIKNKGDTNNGNNGAAQPCKECGKLFPSRKALFGHMRCHPDRPYRGINPPPGLSKLLSLQFPRSSTTSCSFTGSEYEAAQSLIMLTNAPQANCCVFSTPHKNYFWDLNLPPPMDHEEYCDHGSSSPSSSSSNPKYPAGLDLKLRIYNS